MPPTVLSLFLLVLLTPLTAAYTEVISTAQQQKISEVRATVEQEVESSSEDDAEKFFLPIVHEKPTDHKPDHGDHHSSEEHDHHEPIHHNVPEHHPIVEHKPTHIHNPKPDISPELIHHKPKPHKPEPFGLLINHFKPLQHQGSIVAFPDPEDIQEHYPIKPGHPHGTSHSHSPDPHHPHKVEHEPDHHETNHHDAPVFPKPPFDWFGGIDVHKPEFLDKWSQSWSQVLSSLKSPSGVDHKPWGTHHYHHHYVHHVIAPPHGDVYHEEGNYPLPEVHSNDNSPDYDNHEIPYIPEHYYQHDKTPFLDHHHGFHHFFQHFHPFHHTEEHHDPEHHEEHHHRKPHQNLTDQEPSHDNKTESDKTNEKTTPQPTDNKRKHTIGYYQYRPSVLPQYLPATTESHYDLDSKPSTGVDHHESQAPEKPKPTYTPFSQMFPQIFWPFTSRPATKSKLSKKQNKEKEDSQKKEDRKKTKEPIFSLFSLR